MTVGELKNQLKDIPNNFKVVVYTPITYFKISEVSTDGETAQIECVDILNDYKGSE